MEESPTKPDDMDLVTVHEDLDSKIVISEEEEVEEETNETCEQENEGDDPLGLIAQGMSSKTPEPKYCCAPGCKNKSNTPEFVSRGLKMYFLRHSNTKDYNLWAMAIRRAKGDRSYQPPKIIKMCSAHFVFG